MTDLIIRPYQVSDKSFIMDSWIRSSLNMSSMKWIPRKVAARGHSIAISKALKRNKTYITCVDDEPDAIVAWMCGEPPLLHYAYAKWEYRGHGLIKDMLTKAQQEAGLDYNSFSFWPRDGWHSKTRHWIYSPQSFWDTTSMEELDENKT